MRHVRRRPPSTRWARAALLLSLAFGLAFAVATPPSQAPDEPAHFRRAYAISEGQLVARKKDGLAGNEIPRSVVRVSHDLLDGLPFHPERKQRPAAVREAFSTPLAPGDRQFVPYPNTALYGPVAYIPQAAAIASGRLATDSVLTLFYLGRLANVAAGSILLAIALASTPAGRPILFLVGLLPMTVFQMSSLSADASTNALAFLWTALVVGLAGTPVEAGRGRIAALALVAVLLALAKPGYAPLAGLVFLVPPERFGPSRRAGLFRWLVLGAALAAAAAWAALASRLLPSGPVSSGARFASLLGAASSISSPEALAAAVRSVPRLAVGFVGKLGWADVSLPVPLVAAHALILLFAALFSGGDGVGGIRRKAILVAVGAATVLTAAVPYLVPLLPPGPEGAAAHHFQGRYLIPVAPTAMLLLGSRRWSLDWDRRLAALSLWTAAVLAAALAAVLVRYYL